MGITLCLSGVIASVLIVDFLIKRSSDKDIAKDGEKKFSKDLIVKISFTKKESKETLERLKFDEECEKIEYLDYVPENKVFNF